MGVHSPPSPARRFPPRIRISGEPVEHSDAECEGQSIPSGLGRMQRAATSPNSPYNDAFGEDHLLRYRYHRDKDLTGI